MPIIKTDPKGNVEIDRNTGIAVLLAGISVRFVNSDEMFNKIPAVIKLVFLCLHFFSHAACNYFHMVLYYEKKVYHIPKQAAGRIYERNCQLDFIPYPSARP